MLFRTNWKNKNYNVEVNFLQFPQIVKFFSKKMLKNVKKCMLNIRFKLKIQ